MSDNAEDFQKTAEAFAASVPVPQADQVTKRRGELHTDLLAKVSDAAQARANLIAASQHGVDFRIASDWRGKYAAAEMTLAALVEFEAGLL